MADFSIAHYKTGLHEGVYSDDPVDKGGETFRGVSRKSNPDPELWDRIDALKGVGFPQNAYEDKDITLMVEQIYKRRYWDVFGFDNPAMPQELANEIFDSAVNHWTKQTTKFIQRVLTSLTDEYVEDDGVFGQDTSTVFWKFIETESKERIEAFQKLFACLRGAFYVEIVNKDPEQGRFINGWSKRVPPVTMVADATHLIQEFHYSAPPPEQGRPYEPTPEEKQAFEENSSSMEERAELSFWERLSVQNIFSSDGIVSTIVGVLLSFAGAANIDWLLNFVTAIQTLFIDNPAGQALFGDVHSIGDAVANGEWAKALVALALLVLGAYQILTKDKKHIKDRINDSRIPVTVGGKK
jgi:lysozyme family protein